MLFRSEDITLKVGNEQIKNPKIIASMFNKFFLNVTSQLNITQGSKDVALSFLKGSYQTKFPEFKAECVTPAEIVKIIQALKSKSS